MEWDRSVTRRTVMGGLALLPALGMMGRLAAVAAGATADATPAAGEVNELSIATTAAGFEMPDTLPAGLTRITLDNRRDGDVDILIAKLPEGRGAEELHAEIAKGPADAAAWVRDVPFVGGPIASAGTTAQTMTEFTPGAWAFMSGPVGAVTLTVTDAGPAAQTPEPEAALAIALKAYEFVGLPGTVPAGPQAWKVTNTGPEMHFLEIVHSPVAVTVPELIAMLQAHHDGLPMPAGAPEFGDLVTVGGISALSPGQTGWVLPDLAPGYYVAVCFFPGENGMPHAMMGMIAPFTVEAA